MRWRWRHDRPRVGRMRGDRPGGEAAWLDADAGPLVRSFALTGGRTRVRREFELLTHVVTTERGARGRGDLPPEQRAIVTRAARPASVAEIASYVDRPVGVVRVLLSDLLAAGAIALAAPARTHRSDDRVLSAVLDGLRSL